MFKSLLSAKSEQQCLAQESQDHPDTTVTPDVKNIVKESIDLGLPLIPFAQPSIFIFDEKDDKYPSVSQPSSTENLRLKRNSILEEDQPLDNYPQPSYKMCKSSSKLTLKSEDYMQMDQIYKGNPMFESQSLPDSRYNCRSKESKSPRFGKLFKKANRYKEDYVFVDFERENYVDMDRISDKNWKFLTYFPRNKKNSC